MNNFEKITRSPETLADFLGSLPVSDGPWDEEFHKRICEGCEADNCDAENCHHPRERHNPAWWLGLEAEEAGDDAAHGAVENGYRPTLRGTAPMEYLEHAGYFMDALARAFLGLGSRCTNKKKFQVTIECDPETGKVRWERADLTRIYEEIDNRETAIQELVNKQGRFPDQVKERASQILQLLEGLRICEARYVLENCRDALADVRLDYGSEGQNT